MGDSKVSKDFSGSKYTDKGLSTKTSYILDKMDGNTAFPTPVPALKDIAEANTNYIAALGKVEYGTKADTVIKNNLRGILTVLLKQLADYVQTTSNGDEAIILSAGFEVNKKPSSIGALAKPENITAKPGDNKGSMVIMCDVVENANYYEFEYIEASAPAGTKWTQKTSTKRKLQIDGLISGLEYKYRVAGAGSDPSRIWSEIVTSFVL